MVRSDQVTPVISTNSGRSGQGNAPIGAICGSRLLKPDPRSAKTALVEDAKRQGFDIVRVAAPDSAPKAGGRLHAFLAAERHGNMGWMESTAARRAAPTAMWPDVRSVVMLGLNYGPNDDPMAVLAQRDRGAISVYARNRDYHDVIKGRLKQIAARFAARSGAVVKVFVDTAPLMEKPLAEAAGIGWQGKHTNVVSREFGSWLFLGAILTDLEIPYDDAEEDHCGSCRACIDICPTDAFPAPYQLDARRCISYLTIEHDGPIPHEFRAAIGNRIYGCDDCLAVCPWNRFAKQGREAKLSARDDLNAPFLAELVRLDDRAFRRFFAGSPIKRIGRDRFVRNVLIAIGNSRDGSLASEAEPLLDDATAQVRGAAIWAVWRLTSEVALATHRARRMEQESDPTVIAEWRAASGSSFASDANRETVANREIIQ